MFSTSFLIILPFSPEPFTSDKLIPLSEAIFLAKGEAKILPFEAFTVVFVSVECETSDSFSTGFSIVFSSVIEAVAVIFPERILETSVSFGPIIANKLSTVVVSPS